MNNKLSTCWQYLSSFEWYDLGVVGGADDRVILGYWITVASLTKELVTVSRRVSEVLPCLPCLSMIFGPLQSKHSRTWRVSHLDEYVCNVELLNTNCNTITTSHETVSLYYGRTMTGRPRDWQIMHRELFKVVKTTETTGTDKQGPAHRHHRQKTYRNRYNIAYNRLISDHTVSFTVVWWWHSYITLSIWWYAQYHYAITVFC